MKYQDDEDGAHGNLKNIDNLRWTSECYICRNQASAAAIGTKKFQVFASYSI